jgi:predicted secreted hydrolase
MQGTSYQALPGSAFVVEDLGHWTSPHTGIVYPSKWKVTFDGASYIVTPLIADQEFHEPPPFETYWEGTCSVATPAGQVVGQAYVELNGFKKPAPSGGEGRL